MTWRSMDTAPADRWILIKRGVASWGEAGSCSIAIRDGERWLVEGPDGPAGVIYNPEGWQPLPYN